MKILKLLSAAAVAASLVACGGGGDGGPSTAGNAEGFWRGTASTGYDVMIAVLDDGETWGLYKSGGTVYGAVYGQSNGSGTTFSASGTDYNFASWSAASGTYSGTVAAKSTINATSSNGSTISLTYTDFYDQTPSLSTIAGTYTISGVSSLGSASSVPMTISSNGAVSIVGASTCNASGTVAPHASGKNIYTINLTFTGTSCALGNGTNTTGIFVLNTETTPANALAMAFKSDKSDGFIAVGLKN